MWHCCRCCRFHNRKRIPEVDCYYWYVTQLCLTLCDPMDCSPPGSSVHGILQPRILESVAISFSRGSSQPRDWTPISHIAGRFFLPSFCHQGSPLWYLDSNRKFGDIFGNVCGKFGLGGWIYCWSSWATPKLLEQQHGVSSTFMIKKFPSKCYLYIIQENTSACFGNILLLHVGKIC